MQSIRRFVQRIMCNTSNALVRSLVIWDHTVLPATHLTGDSHTITLAIHRHVAGAHLSTQEG